MNRYLTPLIFGLGGTAVLISLAVWQLQRLEWKTALIAELESRASADPVALPPSPDETAHALLTIKATGAFGDPVLHVLTSAKPEGPGFRVIQPFTTEGRTIMVDRGHRDRRAPLAE